ncbi:MAG: GDSL-type esterase/lipase family protein [Verrucomicrobiota bacterium]
MFAFPKHLLAILAAMSATPAWAVTIWPIGDSLTSGFTVAGAYRPSLYNNLIRAGEPVTFVGSSTADATTTLTTTGQFRHDGHSSWFIADTPGSSMDNGKGLYESVQSWHATIPSPQVILLMIGTNDLNLNNSVSTASGRFALLLSRLEGLSPSARIIVGAVPKASETNRYKDASVTTLNASIQSYNNSISAVVAAHAANGKKVEFLDVNAAMTLADLGSDGLHFSQAGYNKLGSLWASAVLIPEPNTLLLLLLSLFCMGIRRR